MTCMKRHAYSCISIEWEALHDYSWLALESQRFERSRQVFALIACENLTHVQIAIETHFECIILFMQDDHSTAYLEG